MTPVVYSQDGVKFIIIDTDVTTPQFDGANWVNIPHVIFQGTLDTLASKIEGYNRGIASMQTQISEANDNIALIDTYKTANPNLGNS